MNLADRTTAGRRKSPALLVGSYVVVGLIGGFLVGTFVHLPPVSRGLVHPMMDVRGGQAVFDIGFLGSPPSAVAAAFPKPFGGPLAFSDVVDGQHRFGDGAIITIKAPSISSNPVPIFYVNVPPSTILVNLCSPASGLTLKGLVHPMATVREDATTHAITWVLDADSLDGLGIKPNLERFSSSGSPLYDGYVLRYKNGDQNSVAVYVRTAAISSGVPQPQATVLHPGPACPIY